MVRGLPTGLVASQNNLCVFDFAPKVMATILLSLNRFQTFTGRSRAAQHRSEWSGRAEGRHASVTVTPLTPGSSHAARGTITQRATFEWAWSEWHPAMT
jgi:hypothetical protein